MRLDLPTGTVTFLFTDVEGSTKLLHEVGAEAYAEALAEHRRVIREAVLAHGGVEVDTQGDAFFVAFPTAPGALAAAAAARDALQIRVRMGLHSGTPLLTDEGYVGPDVHRAARIAAVGHGGQILVSASTAALVSDQLRDLGPHRLKDLSAPERIYQLGDDDFSPLKSLHRTNLPIAATPFVGRERELPEVLRLLDASRLLTLTGPGGTGKTRLAAQAAALASEEYPDGVWWVPLAPLRDPNLVLDTAGQSLGSANGVADHIADKRMLVLFDNFEQVVDAATDVSQLLSSCPNLDVLVTSRERLQVTGEQEYPVPPLVHEEGVGFFLARARAVAPDFEPDESVPEICRRLDDLPLALELAAARVKALTTQQILERLEQRLPLLTGGARDLPERQRTLRATIEWSYELLDEQERELFGHLGVFRGGCTLEAAEEVTDADVDTLQSLVDKSLLRRTGDRYWMLETIREFAAERTDEEVRRRHAAYLLALAETAYPHLGGDPGEWLRRLEGEHDNFRAAADWFHELPDGESAQRLTGALYPFWYQRGHFAEGRRRVDAALLLDDRPTRARGKALLGAAGMAASTGDLALAQQRAEQAFELHRLLGEEWGVAYARYMMGLVAARSDRFADAHAIFDESLERFIELGDAHYELIARRALAWMSEELGDYDRFVELYEENLVRARETGNKRLEARSLSVLAERADREGRFADAASLLKQAYGIDCETENVTEIAFDFCRFANLLVFAEEAGTAAKLLAKGEALIEELGAVYESWQVKMNEETRAKIHERLDDAAIEQASREGRELGPEEAVALAVDVLSRA
jgi:predicted ATPase